MKVKVLKEEGFLESLFGIGLSYGLTSEMTFEEFESNLSMQNNMLEIAYKLARSSNDSGHRKFLESIAVWIDIDATRGWWQQESTYRCGVTRQSESTMHTLTKRHLVQDDFEKPIAQQTLVRINQLIDIKDEEQLQIELPEGFLQRRIVCTNYKTLSHIVSQRKNHKRHEWRFFCDCIKIQLAHPELL